MSPCNESRLIFGSVINVDISWYNLEKNKEGDDRDDFMETMQPLDEDCWQYRLVGVNVHQGRANAGHYWSYINTNRSGDKIDSNQDCNRL